MKNLLLLGLSILVVISSVLLPRTVATKDDLGYLTCGAPIPYLSQDVSANYPVSIPDRVNCSFFTGDTVLKNFDVVGFLLSVIIVYAVLMLFSMIRDRLMRKSGVTVSKYPSSPIRASLGDNSANSY
jgi:hypothetical protein